MKISIGADPEGFVFSKKENRFVGAEGLIEGTKDAPFALMYGAMQVDGMAAEINPPPAYSPQEFWDNMKELRKEVSTYLGPDYDLVFTPAVTFDKEVWDKASPQAKRLGCDPDYNAYTGGQNPAPDNGADFRTGAGHIHIGWTEDASPNNKGHFESCRILTKELDYQLALASSLVDTSEEGLKRRYLYGRAGAFRPKPYGCEYRVLSNFWVAEQDLALWVYDVCTFTFKRLREGHYNHQPVGGRPNRAVENALTTAYSLSGFDLYLKLRSEQNDMMILPSNERILKYIEESKKFAPRGEEAFSKAVKLLADRGRLV